MISEIDRTEVIYKKCLFKEKKQKNVKNQLH